MNFEEGISMEDAFLKGWKSIGTNYESESPSKTEQRDWLRGLETRNRGDPLSSWREYINGSTNVSRIQFEDFPLVYATHECTAYN